MKLEEKLLVKEIKNGNEAVFKSLYHEYYPSLVRFASSYLHDEQACQDVVQNFFLDFWQSIPTISISVSLKSYCFMAVKNRCLNKLRDLNLRDQHNLLYIESMISLDATFNETDDKLIDEIGAAIDQLPARMKTVFVKKYFEGLKSREIAEELDLTENTVNTQLKRGKAKLKEMLQKRLSLLFMF